MTLPSNSNRTEFPDNQPNNFKVRLAEPLRLHGGGWSVGLSSVSLPDEKMNLFALDYARAPFPFNFRSVKGEDALETFEFDPKEVLMKMDYHRYKATLSKDAKKNTLALGTGRDTGRLLPDTPANRQALNLTSWNFITTSTCTFHEVLQDKSTIVDGVEFMKFVVHNALQEPFKRLSSYNSLIDADGQFTLLEPEWMNHVGHNELRIKKKVYGSNRDQDYVRLGINVKLGVAMGWFTNADHWEIVRLGSDIVVDDLNDPIRAGPVRSNGRPWYRWTEVKTETLNGIQTGMVYLNPYYTWRFINFKARFQTVMGSPSRTLLVYPEVAESSKVGDQVVDLLREVEYKRENKATVYFEPMHIHYLPIRNEYIEMIQTQVSETNGKLANLQGGHTLLTLHFKKQ